MTSLRLIFPKIKELVRGLNSLKVYRTIKANCEH